jgi:hypothetical protein
MVIDVFLKKNMRTFFRDQIRRTFWRKFHEFNNHAARKAAGISIYAGYESSQDKI